MAACSGDWRGQAVAAVEGLIDGYELQFELEEANDGSDSDSSSDSIATEHCDVDEDEPAALIEYTVDFCLTQLTKNLQKNGLRDSFNVAIQWFNELKAKNQEEKSYKLSAFVRDFKFISQNYNLLTCRKLIDDITSELAMAQMFVSKSKTPEIAVLALCKKAKQSETKCKTLPDSDVDYIELLEDIEAAKKIDCEDFSSITSQATTTQKPETNYDDNFSTTSDKQDCSSEIIKIEPGYYHVREVMGKVLKNMTEVEYLIKWATMGGDMITLEPASSLSTDSFEDIDALLTNVRSLDTSKSTSSEN